MEKYLEIMKKSELFINIRNEEIETLFDCLNVRIEDYEKGEFILNAGEETRELGLVLEGQVHIINEDYWGNRTIINNTLEGEIFGESFACAGQNLSVSILAMEKTKVMLIDFTKIIHTCSSTIHLREIIVRNLLNIIAKSNLKLTTKIEHMSKRTTREKLLSYLSDQAFINKSPNFVIPFNRQQLADYLCIERSAMSNELSKLRGEGVLEFRKDEFKLLKI